MVDVVVLRNSRFDKQWLLACGQTVRRSAVVQAAGHERSGPRFDYVFLHPVKAAYLLKI